MSDEDESTRALLAEAVSEWYDEYRGCAYGWCKFCGASAYGYTGMTVTLDTAHEPDCLVLRAEALTQIADEADVKNGQ